MASEYRKVVVDDLPNAPNPTTAKREVDEAVGATAFGFNVYTVAPGERVPWGYHHHPEHEELFYVLAGELSVDTPDGTFTVGAEEAFFVPAGGRNLAHNADDVPVRMVAVGAPKDADGAVIEEECPACGESTGRDASRTDGVVVLTCTDCGAETDRFSA